MKYSYCFFNCLSKYLASLPSINLIFFFIFRFILSSVAFEYKISYISGFLTPLYSHYFFFTFSFFVLSSTSAPATASLSPVSHVPKNFPATHFCHIHIFRAASYWISENQALTFLISSNSSCCFGRNNCVIVAGTRPYVHFAWFPATFPDTGLIFPVTDLATSTGRDKSLDFRVTTPPGAKLRLSPFVFVLLSSFQAMFRR